MKHVLVLRQVPHEVQGMLEVHFSEVGLESRDVNLFEAVPERLDLDRAAALVVLGGPMNVDEVEKFPFLKAEVDWLAEAVARKLPTLGICLGAQVLAKSLGSRVYANRVKEIGWYTIELTPEAAADPLFVECRPVETVFQWHGDTFDLPPGAVPLARSKLCENQAFRFGPSAYGLQFHVEMTPEMVELWLDEAENCRELAGLDYIDPAAIRASLPHHYPEMEAFGRRVLARFAAFAARGARG